MSEPDPAVLAAQREELRQASVMLSNAYADFAEAEQRASRTNCLAPPGTELELNEHAAEYAAKAADVLDPPEAYDPPEGTS